MGDYACVNQGSLSLTAGESEAGSHVQEHKVVVSPPSDEPCTPPHKTFRQSTCILYDVDGISSERGLASLRQSNGLGSHHVGQRATEDHRASFVYTGCIFLGAED